MKTLIVDYGLCNIDSVKRAVEECGGTAVISNDPFEASVSDRIILPGVGNFSEAMHALRTSGWETALRREVMENKIPFLGICLGMQLIATQGTEGGDTEGFGFIPGRVLLMSSNNGGMRIPHVGWNEVHQSRDSSLFEGIPDRQDFYFVHSYHFVPQSKDDALATTPYCGNIVAAIGRGNVFGTQFHPEKSLHAGFRLLRNFLAV